MLLLKTLKWSILFGLARELQVEIVELGCPDWNLETQPTVRLKTGPFLYRVPQGPNKDNLVPSNRRTLRPLVEGTKMVWSRALGWLGPLRQGHQVDGIYLGHFISDF